MGRWAQYDEDECRLPEDLVRIAYDADSRQYTFRDKSSGQLYRSTPGNAYGTLSPISDRLDSRPNAFAPTHGHSRSQSAQNPFTTFHDILPSHAITTSSTNTSPPSAFGSRFRSSAAPNHLRSQSTRVPPSSQTTNVHMRSKSQTVRNRDQHGTHSRPRDTQRQGHHHQDIHSHPRDTRHQGHNQHDKDAHPRDTQHVQGDVTSSRKNARKSGFSFSSALQCISRSWTNVRNRGRQPNHLRRHSDTDAKDSYLYL